MEEAHKGLGEVDERRRRVHVDGSKLRKERKKMVKHMDFKFCVGYSV